MLLVLTRCYAVLYVFACFVVGDGDTAVSRTGRKGG